MTCEQAKTSLLDYLMEEVTAAERLEIRQHVDGCAACAGEMARLKQTLTLLVRAEVPEEIPQRIRLVPEPVSVWTLFWRSGARLSFATAGLACLAIGLLALSQASISHDQGGWAIAFGQASRATSGVPTVETATTAGALDRAEVVRLVAEAVAASEARQQAGSVNLVQAAVQQGDQQRARDLQELSESFRYIQAAQTMMWKDQVQNQEVMGALARRAGLPLTQP